MQIRNSNLLTIRIRIQIYNRISQLDNSGSYQVSLYPFDEGRKLGCVQRNIMNCMQVSPITLASWGHIFWFGQPWRLMRRHTVDIMA